METMIVTGGAGHGHDRSSLPTLVERAARVLRASVADGSRRRGRSGLGDSEAQPAPFFDPTLDVTPAGRR